MCSVVVLLVAGWFVSQLKSLKTAEKTDSFLHLLISEMNQVKHYNNYCTFLSKFLTRKC